MAIGVFPLDYDLYPKTNPKGATMTTLSKLTITAMTTMLVTLVLTANVDAETTVRIKSLTARDLSERAGGFDDIRIECRADGGPMQVVRRKMRLGDAWEVSLPLTFHRQVTISVFEKERWIKRDKKLGEFTLCSTSIPVGKFDVFTLTGHGARYEMVVDRGRNPLSRHVKAYTTVNIDTLKALDLSEDKYGFDRIFIRYSADGGPTQSVGRKMRYGDEWRVDRKVRFYRTLTISVYEKEWGPLRDKKIGAFTICADSIAEGTSKELKLTGSGGDYWLLVGRGNYTRIKPPDGGKPLPPKPADWKQGGIYVSPNDASQAGRDLVLVGRAKEFEVYPIPNYRNVFGEYVYYETWGLRYRPTE